MYMYMYMYVYYVHVYVYFNNSYLHGVLLVPLITIQKCVHCTVKTVTIVLFLSFLQDPKLRKAILQLVSYSIGNQPGLLELFLSLKKKLDKKPTTKTTTTTTTTSSTITNTNTSSDKGSSINNEFVSSVYVIDEDSCLWSVIDMIDPEKQVNHVIDM